MNGIITDTELRALKGGYYQPYPRVEGVPLVSVEVPASSLQSVKLGLQPAPALGEPHHGEARLFVTVDGRDPQLSQFFPQEKNLRIQVSVVHAA